MTEKFKILAKYIKDLSSETPDAETYIYVRDRISKYQLDININSKVSINVIIFFIVFRFYFFSKLIKNHSSTEWKYEQKP